MESVIPICFEWLSMSSVADSHAKKLILGLGSFAEHPAPFFLLLFDIADAAKSAPGVSRSLDILSSLTTFASIRIEPLENQISSRLIEVGHLFKKQVSSSFATKFHS